MRMDDRGSVEESDSSVDLVEVRRSSRTLQHPEQERDREGSSLSGSIRGYNPDVDGVESDASSFSFTMSAGVRSSPRQQRRRGEDDGGSSEASSRVASFVNMSREPSDNAGEESDASGDMSGSVSMASPSTIRRSARDPSPRERQEDDGYTHVVGGRRVRSTGGGGSMTSPVTVASSQESGRSHGGGTGVQQSEGDASGSAGGGASCSDGSKETKKRTKQGARAEGVSSE